MKTEKDLEGKTYIHCSACMSVWADALSWANAESDRITKNIEEADNVVVLGCQVTDLAILNDLRVLKRLSGLRGVGKSWFMGGCLGQREDIQMPRGVGRIAPLRTDYTIIKDKSLVTLEKPFWIKDFKEDGENNLKPGNLFRNHYPLRIGVGCSGNCSYCTIKKTRAGAYDLDDHRSLLNEMLYAKQTGQDVLLIADSPSYDQLLVMSKYAIEYETKISFRNVEPHVLCKMFKNELGENVFVELVQRGLMEYMHSPLQHIDRNVIKDMNRSFEKTKLAFKHLVWLREQGVKTATNVILNYRKDAGIFDDWGDRKLVAFLERHIDYVSWNPLWDGVWDEKKAIERFDQYSKDFD